ncbi:MAG: T9SS type A sorting domain-containing protein [Saprospirales bacterium]|nr:T9SS type A sorting domain-containing protein [Saprospirales bacterium]
MNVFLLPPPTRVILLECLALFGVSIGVFGQNTSPYKSLITAKNTLVNDTVSGQNLSIYAVSPQPKHGDVDITLLQTGGSGNPYLYAVQYTPDPGYTGVDTFTVELNFQGAYPYLIYRGYRVSVYPSLLTANADFAVTTAGASVTTNVLANDHSTAGPLTLNAIPQIKNGTAVISGASSIQFTPAPGFSGMSYVNYVVCDTAGACKTAQYSIGVHNTALPTSDTLRVATAKNTPLTMPLLYTGYSTFQAPANGILVMDNGHAFRYVPNLNFTGTDQFILSTNAYGPPAYKTVVLQVLNTAGQNTMALDDIRFTPKNTAVTFNVRNNDIGNLLVKSWVIPANLPGTVSSTNGIGNVTFTPHPGFSGVATFYYKIGNMFVPDLEMAAVHVAVGNMNPAAASYDLTTPKSTALVINYKIPFTGFNFSILDPPDHGNLNYFPGFSTQIINGQSVSGYNLLVYAPNNNYTGLDQFEINYCVTSNGQCQPVKVTMSVVDVFSAPAPYCIDDCVWSGDVNSDGVVNNVDILPLGYLMGLSGPTRNYAALEWYGQHAGNWNNPYLGKNADLKHADTDGNGQITTDDTLAVSYFYGQTHQLAPKIPATSKGLPFFLKILTPNPGVGDLVEVELSLGNQSQPLTNLYGFTFDVSLSPHIVDSAFQLQYFNGSWVNANAPDLWMYKTPAQGRLESAFTRTNGVSASGHGLIGVFSFIIIDIVDDSKLNSSPYFSIQIDAPNALWADGAITQGEPLTLNIPLRLHARAPDSPQPLLVYPSPARDLLNIHLNGDAVVESLWIYDAAGRTVYTSGPVQWEHAEINIGDLPDGFYVAAAQTNQGSAIKKFQILR